MSYTIVIESDDGKMIGVAGDVSETTVLEQHGYDPETTTYKIE